MDPILFPIHGKCLLLNFLWSVYSHSGLTSLLVLVLVLLSSWVTNPELKPQHIHTECAWSVRAETACVISREQHYFGKTGLVHHLRLLCHTATWEMKTQHLAFWDNRGWTTVRWTGWCAVSVIISKDQLIKRILPDSHSEEQHNNRSMMSEITFKTASTVLFGSFDSTDSVVRFRLPSLNWKTRFWSVNCGILLSLFLHNDAKQIVFLGNYSLILSHITPWSPSSHKCPFIYLFAKQSCNKWDNIQSAIHYCKIIPFCMI